LDQETSLYAQYLLEREGKSLISNEDGFATYQKLSNGDYWLVDIFVQKRGDEGNGRVRRRNGRMLFDGVIEIAKNDGAANLVTSVCLGANEVSHSMKIILGNGFLYSHADNASHMLYFKKSLE